MIAPIGSAERYLASPVSLLSRFRPPADLPARVAGLPADVAEISDLARSLLAERVAGATESRQQLDVHLELTELGLGVDAAGRYDARARSLTVDLHVTSRTGVLDLGDRTVEFQELHLDLTVNQVEMQRSDTRAQGGEARDRLAEALKGLIALLHDADQEETGRLPALSGGLTGLLADPLREFIEAIVEALSDLGGLEPSPAQPGGVLEQTRQEMRLEVRSLSTTFAAPLAGSPAPNEAIVAS